MSDEREVFLEMVRGMQTEAAYSWSIGRSLAQQGWLTTAGDWQQAAATKYERARVAMDVLRDSDLLAQHMDGLAYALEAVADAKARFIQAIRDGEVEVRFPDEKSRWLSDASGPGTEGCGDE